MKFFVAFAALVSVFAWGATVEAAGCGCSCGSKPMAMPSSMSMPMPVSGGMSTIHNMSTSAGTPSCCKTGFMSAPMSIFPSTSSSPTSSPNVQVAPPAIIAPHAHHH